MNNISRAEFAQNILGPRGLIYDEAVALSHQDTISILMRNWFPFDEERKFIIQWLRSFILDNNSRTYPKLVITHGSCNTGQTTFFEIIRNIVSEEQRDHFFEGDFPERMMHDPTLIISHWVRRIYTTEFFLSTRHICLSITQRDLEVNDRLANFINMFQEQTVFIPFRNILVESPNGPFQARRLILPDLNELSLAMFKYVFEHSEEDEIGRDLPLSMCEYRSTVIQNYLEHVRDMEEERANSLRRNYLHRELNLSSYFNSDRTELENRAVNRRRRRRVHKICDDDMFQPYISKNDDDICCICFNGVNTKQQMTSSDSEYEDEEEDENETKATNKIFTISMGLKLSKYRSPDIITKCDAGGHIFHKECFKQWIHFSVNKNCPSCRHSFASEKEEIPSARRRIIFTSDDEENTLPQVERPNYDV